MEIVVVPLLPNEKRKGGEANPNCQCGVKRHDNQRKQNAVGRLHPAADGLTVQRPPVPARRWLAILKTVHVLIRCGIPTMNKMSYSKRDVANDEKREDRNPCVSKCASQNWGDDQK